MWHIRLAYELPKEVRQKTKNRMYKTILKKQRFMINKKIKQDSNWKKLKKKFSAGFYSCPVPGVKILKKNTKKKML